MNLVFESHFNQELTFLQWRKGHSLWRFVLVLHPLSLLLFEKHMTTLVDEIQEVQDWK